MEQCRAHTPWIPVPQQALLLVVLLRRCRIDGAASASHASSPRGARGMLGAALTGGTRGTASQRLEAARAARQLGGCIRVLATPLCQLHIRLSCHSCSCCCSRRRLEVAAAAIRCRPARRRLLPVQRLDLPGKELGQGAADEDLGDLAHHAGDDEQALLGDV